MLEFVRNPKIEDFLKLGFVRTPERGILQSFFFFVAQERL
jgi:hypothetical protein